MIRFVVFGDNRSGSHFLQSLLHSHPAINCYWDIFWARDETPLGFRNYCSKVPARGILGLFAKRILIRDFLYRHFAGQYAKRGDKPGDVGATGFLLKYGAAQRHPSILKWLRANGVRIIHIVRMNHLNHEIAFALRRSGVVESHARIPIEFRPVRLETVNLVKRLDGMQEQLEKMRKKIVGCETLEIKYEDLLANLEGEVSRILTFLNVAASAPLQSKFYKTESENPQEMLENYDEVRKALSGTRYETYL